MKLCIFLNLCISIRFTFAGDQSQLMFESEVERSSHNHECAAYNQKAVLCRKNHCFYNCANGQCSKIRDGQSNTCTSSRCDQFCSDICLCVSKKCQFVVDGLCQDTKHLGCPENVFRRGQCGRKHGYYVSNGMFCKNDKSRGFCKIEKTILAVNLGGKSIIDKRGIVYATDNADQYVDQHNIRREHHLSSVDGFDEDDAILYATVIHADTSLRESGRCIIYPVHVCDNGMYELTIKTIEAFDVAAGEKVFNVKLGNHYIFREVDIMGLAGSKLRPIELIMNFEVKNKVMLVDGMKTLQISNGTVPLSFCYSECEFIEGYFEIAAFSINKLVDWKLEQDSNSCGLFNGMFWECINAHCIYNHTTGECTTLKEETKLTCFDPKPGSGSGSGSEECENASPALELLFVLDSTESCYQKGCKYSRSNVFDAFQSIAKSVDYLRKRFKKSKFGITLFNEFPCRDHPLVGGHTDSCKWLHGSGIKNHNEKEGCYRRHQPLTEDLSLFHSSSERRKLTTLMSDKKEPGIFALMLAAEDTTIGWTTGKKKGVQKVIVLVTDDGLRTTDVDRHGRKRHPKGDGTDSCQWTKHPDKSFVKKLIDREGIIVYLLHNDGESYSDYAAYFKRTNIIIKASSMKLKPEDFANYVGNFALEKYDFN